MELMDSSMDKIADKVYHKLHSTIPEDVLGKMTVAVRDHPHLHISYSFVRCYWYSRVPIDLPTLPQLLIICKELEVGKTWEQI